MTPISQPSGLGALSASMSTEPDRKTEAIQRAQVGSLMGANGNNEPQNKSPKRQTPASGARPKRYALEMWVEIETSVGVHAAPDYCGYLTFQEQRNTIENLHQKPQEAAIDFLIRVGTSVSNLGKDWKDELTDEELQSLQYEVSINGVHEEIRHILDSEIAKNGGKLTPQQNV